MNVNININKVATLSRARRYTTQTQKCVCVSPKNRPTQFSTVVDTSQCTSWMHVYNNQHITARSVSHMCRQCAQVHVDHTNCADGGICVVHRAWTVSAKVNFALFICRVEFIVHTRTDCSEMCIFNVKEVFVVLWWVRRAQIALGDPIIIMFTTTGLLIFNVSAKRLFKVSWPGCPTLCHNNFQ